MLALYFPDAFVFCSSHINVTIFLMDPTLLQRRRVKPKDINFDIVIPIFANLYQFFFLAELLTTNYMLNKCEINTCILMILFTY